MQREGETTRGNRRRSTHRTEGQPVGRKGRRASVSCEGQGRGHQRHAGGRKGMYTSSREDREAQSREHGYKNVRDAESRGDAERDEIMDSNVRRICYECLCTHGL